MLGRQFFESQFHVAILLLILGTSALASVPASWYEDADLRDIHFVDDQYGWAVGDLGTVWHTQNGGEIWRRQATPVDCQLSTVNFVDRSVGYAAGGKVLPLTHRSKGVLLRTEDGGKTWEQTSGLLLPWVTKIHFATKKQGFAVGHSSSLQPSGAWSTRDGGRTWTPLQGVSGHHWSDASFLPDARTGVSGLLLSKSGMRAWIDRNRLFSAGRVTQSSANNSVFGALVNPTAGFAGSTKLEVSGDAGNTWSS